MAFNTKPLQLPKLQAGSRGVAVEGWQNFLIEKGFSVGAADGDFGKLSTIATKGFQKKVALPDTGIVDPATYLKALEQGFIFRVVNFSAQIFLDYLNLGIPEIKILQKELSTIGKLNPALVADADFGPNSVKGLAEVYKILDDKFRTTLADRLKLGGLDKKLLTDFEPAMDLLTEFARRRRRRLSGAHWVQFFKASESLDDLNSPFRQQAQSFLKAMTDAGIKVEINNTMRPPERAYMMHYSVKIRRRDIDARDVPGMSGIDIDWSHYTQAASIKGAEEMVMAFEIGDNPAALRSRHTQGLAVDWAITWEKGKPIKIKNASGTIVTLNDPPFGDENERLWTVGSSYGVYKLSYDPPHWSVDGG
jgi:hypothetical protein